VPMSAHSEAQDGVGAKHSEPRKMVVLHVRRTEQGAGVPSRFVYEWRMLPEDRVAPLQQDFSVEITDAVVEALCSRISAIVESSLVPGQVGSADYLAELRVPGTLLFRTLFPRFETYIADLADRLCANRDPLLVCTNESLVPWELLHDSDDFLGLTREMGRQYVVGTRFAAGRPWGAVRRALLVADPMGDLPEAGEEARRLASWLEAHGVSCTTVAGSAADLVRVLAELTDGDYELFHYSGHAAVRERSGEAALVLAGQPLDVRTIRSVCSAGAPPVVFLNACASAARLSNLCAAFMTTGSQVAVGTQYRVSEPVARRFAERFYARLTEGAPAGAAVRDARRHVSTGTDAAWAAFVFFGDPTVRIRPEGGVIAPADATGLEPARDSQTAATASSARRKPAAAPRLSSAPEHSAAVSVANPIEHRPRLTGETAALLERVVAAAAPRGGLTSLDLLVGLLVADTPLRRLCEEEGADPDVVRQRAEEILDASPAAANADLRVSRTVAAALGAMPAAGHGPLTLDDLCRAFADIGGGGAGRLLANAGVPLERLRTGTARVLLTKHEPASLFDADGRLLSAHLDPVAEAALHHARQIVHDHGGVIGTAALLAGFGRAGSTRLRGALLAQQDVGAAAVTRLFGPTVSPSAEPLTERDVSPRVRVAIDRALRRARVDEAPLVDDTALLCALLRDRDASARALLASLGVDVERLTNRLRAVRADVPPGSTISAASDTKEEGG
jgi:hypothetical protein